MIKTYLLGSALALVLAGCSSSGTGPSVSQSAALVTCGSEVAAINVLADLKHSGKLSLSQIDIINTDINVVDPVCSNKDPNTVLSGAVEAAAAELIALAGGH